VQSSNAPFVTPDLLLLAQEQSQSFVSCPLNTHFADDSATVKVGKSAVSEKITKQCDALHRTAARNLAEVLH